MKKILTLCLAFAMVLSMTACGCKHEAADLTLTDVDTATLSAKWSVKCTVCGKELEKREASTGVSPKDGSVQLSATQWQECLVTNIQQLGAGQTLYAYPAQADDGALLHSIVSMSQMFAVFSYRDSEGKVLLVEQGDTQNLVHNIYMEAQFTNDNAKEFFMLLMIILINNNVELEFEEANTLAAQVMGGSPVTNNGYTYAMEILSAEDHKVGVSITAE